MTQVEAETTSPRGGGFTLLFTFLGGALLGGAAALLFAPGSGRDTRRRITDAVGGSREVASRLPSAVRHASSAARTAFTAALKESEGEDGSAADRHHS